MFFFERLWKCIVQLSGNVWEVTMGTRDFTSTSYLMICRCIFAKLTTHWVTDVTKLSLVSPEHRSTLPTSIPKKFLHVIFKYLQTVVKAEDQYLSSYLIVEAYRRCWCWSNFLVLPGCTAADRHLYIGPRHTEKFAVFGGCTCNPSVKKKGRNFCRHWRMAVWLFSPKEGEATTVLVVKWD